MSLIRRRLPVGPVGTHGTSTQVRLRCSDFSSDMKSHTANTWCSRKVRIAGPLSSAAYSGCSMTARLASLICSSRRSIPGCRWPQS